ncbi:hypothetical protein DUI87_30711 [Hirundo rustica rustica]|uniref:Uncharacterized protein n=1 Tax=Hirundo rustica rustica TaxID=333673 RepID=A0A3M0IVI5_HIRRU|nr:hypothetical protein DUI87_30711 [Hirundo rustica rustica]
MERGMGWDRHVQVIAGGQWEARGRRERRDNAARPGHGMGCRAVGLDAVRLRESGRIPPLCSALMGYRGHEDEDDVEHLCFVRKGSGSWAC